jgi:hypothetical protein
MRKSTIVDLDNMRPHDWAIFVCLYEDCFNTFQTEIPRRKSAITDTCCPKCGRNRIAYWIFDGKDHEFVVHFGRKRKR